jgi:hypothetical protein
LRNGKSVVAGGSGGTVQGIARLQIHLTAKANKRLKQLGRLKTSLTITFAPTNGDAPAPVTKLVTFKSR